jgi:hypothetical protein
MASIQQAPNNMAAANPNVPGNPSLPGEITPQRLQEVYQVNYPILDFLTIPNQFSLTIH